ncbi:MAG: PAN domain-containing protein [Paracoccaceae bacterium]|nr:PAN domain-containing protein [Paracoccaceae bacterium]
MSGTGITRRHLLFGLAGIGIGGAAFGLLGRATRAPAPAPWVPRGLAEDDGWLLPPEERAAFEAADALVESDVFALRDAVDLPGGDLEALRVRSLSECVAACEADGRCEAFTYARASHPQPEKRRICWLKSEAAEREIAGAPDYVSGRRGGWGPD